MPSMNPELLASWGFSQNQLLERDHVLAARERAADLGVGCIDPAGRSMLALLCTLRAPHSIVEIGSGVGVASMAMLEAMGGTGTLTAIESDLEHANAMRQVCAMPASSQHESASSTNALRMCSPDSLTMHTIWCSSMPVPKTSWIMWPKPNAWSELTALLS